MIHFETDDAFWNAFEQFNVLYGGSFFGWTPTTARKEHEDLFSVRIGPRETYFRKDIGSFRDAEKLSMASMEKILYVLIGLNQNLGTRLQMRLDEEAKDLASRLG